VVSAILLQRFDVAARVQRDGAEGREQSKLDAAAAKTADEANVNTLMMDLPLYSNKYRAAGRKGDTHANHKQKFLAGRYMVAPQHSETYSIHNPWHYDMRNQKGGKSAPPLTRFLEADSALLRINHYKCANNPGCSIKAAVEEVVTDESLLWTRPLMERRQQQLMQELKDS
jgi:hypothetical protein